jgi:hypothetical protein
MASNDGPENRVGDHTTLPSTLGKSREMSAQNINDSADLDEL